MVESEVREPADAEIVTGPASTPVSMSDATPPDAVAWPSPLTVPAPVVFVNVTLVVLSPVSRLPAESRTSAVSARVVPAARSAVELVNVM